ncbi:MAG: tyrosine-type recombinase/integrase [Thauera sp.]|nr:tyrosine-type recombinase/integrase [Thauera sp.]
MATDLPSNTRALLARSAFAPELKEFAVWLGGERYTPFVTHLHLLRLEQVFPRLGKPTCSEGDLHGAFVAVGRGVPSRFHRFHATERAYRRFLLARGRLVRDENEGHYARLCIAYERHLRELRGLSVSSCQHHAMTVADFLARGLEAGQELRALTLDDVDRYVALRSREVSRHSLQHVVAYLRSFLRYCHNQGEIGRVLDAIETPRTYRGELPPQALDWSTVQALIRSVDLHSKAGRRDHCILHLMAHYGLRPSEVVALRVDSIDWDAAVLRVVQCKTRTDLLLPLAPQTVRILHGYLAHERRAQDTDYPELFLRARCPSGPLQRYAIGDIFKKRVRQANLELPGHNVYRLRHTFAMRLLTRGVGVKAIGDLLGHHSLESTCAYLRLDIDMLRGVAIEVPEAGLRQGGHHA